MFSKKGYALIIFCKAPIGRIVKTRLSPPLSESQRLKLYLYLLEKNIKTLGNLPFTDTILYYTPPEGSRLFERYGLKGFPQSGKNLGDRMYNALVDTFSHGYKRCVIVGVDLPEMSGEIVINAFSALDDADLVIGPALDGGYYLIGMKKPMKEIFEDIPWSTSNTLKATLKKAESIGLSFHLTQPLSDLDTPEDLKRFPDLLRLLEP